MTRGIDDEILHITKKKSFKSSIFIVSSFCANKKLLCTSIFALSSSLSHYLYLFFHFAHLVCTFVLTIFFLKDLRLLYAWCSRNFVDIFERYQKPLTTPTLLLLLLLLLNVDENLFRSNRNEMIIELYAEILICGFNLRH